MNLRSQAAVMVMEQADERVRRERQLEVLKLAAHNLEKSVGFGEGLREILVALEKQCELILGRICFLDGVSDVGREIRTFEAERPVDLPLEELIAATQQDVLKHWRAKMAPHVRSENARFHSTFDVERNTQFYVLSHPIKFQERRLGSLTCVKVCHGSFEPKSEQAFLAILSALIAQAVMINRFYPDQAASLNEWVTQRAQNDRTQFDRSSVVGNSKPILALFELMQQVADTDTTVLIVGESGVGKELIAEALHRNSSRAHKPFIKVNCAALHESSLESELFGHEVGAFSGAPMQKRGRLELAQGGTLFLDEVGELALSTQVRLLRVLQQREFERIGGEGPVPCDVRVIAATDQNLEKLIEQGQFRQDLYYRLSVFPLHVPALRDRKTDIMPLSDFFVEKYRNLHHKNIRRISTPAIDMLCSYHWPGNVRELENCIERAVLLSQEGVIRGHHLPPSLQIAEPQGKEPGSNLQTILESMERELIVDALKASRGNMAKAARDLGLTERVMGLRARKYAIDPRQHRKPEPMA